MRKIEELWMLAARPCTVGRMLTMGISELEKVHTDAEESYPHECCGVLLGRVADERNIVETAVKCENVRQGSECTRYEIDPRELVRIQRESRESGQEIVGFYHSHPDHPAMWSETDLAEAHWIDCSYLIVSVRGGTARETSSYRLKGRVEEEKRFEEEEIELLGE